MHDTFVFGTASLQLMATLSWECYKFWHAENR